MSLINDAKSLGNGSQNLILETAGRIYVKVADRFYELNFRDQGSGKVEQNVTNNTTIKEEADLSNYVTKKDLKASLAQYITKRDWQDVKQTQKMLEEALLEGFTDSINPITVQTMQMIVGSDQLQFEFIRNIQENPYIVVPHNFGIEDGRLFCDPGIILHHTIDGPQAVQPGTNNSTQSNTKYYCRWTVQDPNSADHVTWFDFTADDQAYYLYIKAEKLNLTEDQKNNPSNWQTKTGNATFYLSDTAVELDPEDGYYYFLYAIINSDTGDGRSIGTMNGFTEILPGQITAYIFKSADGVQFVDFLNKQFHIGYAAEPGELSPSGSANNGSYMHWDEHNGLVIKGNITVTGGELQETLDSLQAQIDAEVQAWFSDDPNNDNVVTHCRPTLNTWPAKNWTIDDAKKEHNGDLYLITDGEYQGEMYRFGKHDGVWGWIQISDNAVAEALNAAHEAQETADTATAKINSWIDDGVISPTELIGLREEYEFVQSDWNNIHKEADLYGLLNSTEYTNYNTAKVAYYNWLGKIITSYDNADEDVLDEFGNVDLDACKTKYSLPNTFKSTMETYYSRRTTMYEKIATSVNTGISNAQTTATNAQTAANTVTQHVTKSLSDGVLTQDEISVLQTYLKSLADQYNALTGAYDDLIAQANEVLSDSDLRQTDPEWIAVNAAKNALNTATTGTKAILDARYQALVTAAQNIISQGVTPVGSINANLASLKTAFDGAATNFTTAIGNYTEDIKELEIAIANANKMLSVAGYKYLKEAIEQGATTIAGGLILSNLLELRTIVEGESGEVTAGINGIVMDTINKTDIAAWFGGEMLDKANYYNYAYNQQSQRYEWTLKPNKTDPGTIAKTVFRHDGTGYIANGNIGWNSDGSGWVAGGALWWNAQGVPTIGGNITIDGSNETFITLSNKVSQILSWFDFDQVNSAIYVKNNYGFYSNSFVSAGGVSTTQGSEGTNLEVVWASLTNQLPDTTYNNVKIVPAHIPIATTTTIGGVKIGSGLEISQDGTLTSASGTVTSIGLEMPNGFSVSNSPITVQGNIRVAFASGYSLPTTTKQTQWDTAYGWGDHAQAGYAAGSDVVTLQGYFTNGSANSALRLSGNSTYSLWGVEYWANGVPKSVTARPTLYIGTTQVQIGAIAQALTGITYGELSSYLKIGMGSPTTTEGSSAKENRRIYFGDTNHYVELTKEGYFHFSHGLYSDSFVSAGGVSNTQGSSGIDSDAMWELLATSGNEQIDESHLATALTNYVNNVTVSGTGNYISDITKSGHTITVTKATLPVQTIYALTIKNSGGTTELTYTPNSAAATLTLTAAMVGLGNVSNIAPSDYFTDFSNITSGTDANKVSITIGGTTKKLEIGYVTKAQKDASGNIITSSYGASLSAASNALKLMAKDGTTILSTITAANLVMVLGNTAVGRATSDANGNNIYNTYVSGVAVGTSTNSDKLAITKGGNTTYITVPYSLTVETTADTTNTLYLVGVTSSATTTLKRDTSITAKGNELTAGKYYIGTSGTASTDWSNGQFLEWDNTNKAWHLIGNFYADGFVSAGGLSSAGGNSGIDADAMWELLSDPTTDKINVSHIPITTSGSGDFVSSITVNSGTPGSIAVSYGSIPVATSSKLGGIKVGSGLSINASTGVLDATYTYTLPLAANGTRGGIQIGYTQSGKNYPVQLLSEKAYVNVPWTDTTYKLSLNGTTNGDSTNGTNLGTLYAPTTVGSNGQVLKSGGSGAPSWVNQSTLYVGEAIYANRVRNNSLSRLRAGNVMFGDGSLHYFLATSTMTDAGRPGKDGHILHLAWDNTGNWDSQIYVGDGDNSTIKHRHLTGSANSWTDWITVYDESNLTKSVLKTILDYGTVGSSTMPIYINNGTFTQITSFPEAYLSWGGKNFTGSYGVLDAAMIPILGANRAAFIKPAGVTIEYSRDDGATWTDYGATNAQKSLLFTRCKSSVAIVIGKAASGDVANEHYQTKVTIYSPACGIYTSINKIAFFVGTNGSKGSNVLVRARTQTNYEEDNDVWTTIIDSGTISGWSGWNVYNVTPFTTYSNTKSTQYGQIEFIFKSTGYNGNGTTNAGLTIYEINLFGGMGLATPSNMAMNGHIYSWDGGQNTTFPNSIYTATNGANLGDTNHRFSLYATTGRFNSTLLVDGTATFNNNVYLANTKNIYIQDNNNSSKSALVIDSTNRFLVGYGTSGSGYATYLDGDTIYLRYSTSHINGITISNTGAVTIAGATTLSSTLAVAGKSTLTGGAEIPSTATLKIGDATIEWIPNSGNGYLKIDKPLLTTGDQIVGSGTPSGGGGGGSASYLSDLLDLSETITDKPSGGGYGLVYSTSATDKNGNSGAWIYVAPGTAANISGANTTARLWSGNVIKSAIEACGYVTTDNKVTQTATTTNSAYELLFSETADNTTRTEGARKTSTLTYNPSTKALLTGGTVDGLTLTPQATGFKISGGTTSKTLTVGASYTLGAACAKAVDTSISAASTSANLPTSAAVASFVEGKGYITSYTDTWRGVYTGGTSRVGTGTGTKAINFVAGSNVTVSYEAAGTGSGQSGNANYFNVKIAATDTTYTNGTGISLSGTTFSLNVAGAKTALGLGTMAYEAKADYVLLATAQTISAKHTFSSGILLNTASSWTSSDRAIAFSADGEDANIRYYYTDSNKGLTFNPSTGELKAAKFTRRGGTSSQFLKADGSVDSSSYITGITSSMVTTALGYTPVTNARTVNGKALSSNITLSLDDVADGSTRKLTNYLPLAGGTMTGNLKWGSGTALPSTTSTSYILCIDAFADGGTTKYISTTNLLSGCVKKAGDSMSGSLAICLTPNSSYPVDRTKATLIVEDDSAAATGEIQGGNIIISRGYSATANQSAGAISFYGRRLSGGYRNGARIASVSSVVGNTYDRQDLVFYASNNTNDSSVAFEEAMRIASTKAVSITDSLSVGATMTASGQIIGLSDIIKYNADRSYRVTLNFDADAQTPTGRFYCIRSDGQVYGDLRINGGLITCVGLSRVGVGTSAPSSSFLLDVNGNINTSGKFYIGGTDGACIEWVPNNGNGYLKINKPLLTVGDQIVNSGTPGGGGGGGGASSLFELADVLTDANKTKVKQYDGTTNAANNNLFAFNGSKWYALKLGTNLAISSGTLNATDTTYSAGTGLALSSGVFSITSAYQTNIANGASAYSTLTTSQTKNKVLASPSSASGAPSFRALVAADLPSIENLTNFSTKVYDASASRTANYVLAAPNGSNGVATFRALVAADIPSLTVSKITDLSISSGTLTVGSTTITPVTDVAVGSGTNADNLAITKGGSASYITVPFATTTRRLKLYSGTAESGGYDLNTLLDGGGITRNYSSTSYWANGPSGMSFGSVAEVYSGGSLSAQFAWDINHNSATPTRRIWWRANSSTHGWQADWHLVYDSSNANLSTVDWTTKALSVNGTSSFASGHLYLTGAQSSSSTANTTQIVFGTSSNNHVAISSNTNSIIINPSTSAMTNQIVLGVDNVNSSFGTSVVFKGSANRFENAAWNNLGVKRTASGGAWICFYPSNQETYFWDVGAGSVSSNSTNFSFEYQGNGVKAYLTPSGTFSTVGDQVISSDINLKTNLQDVTYSVEDIAKTRAVTFDWKDGRGKSAGSIAQDWMHLVPELVHGEEGHMTLAYGQIAMLNTILLARRSEDHETRIKALEAENAKLKEEIKRLKS